MWHAAEWPSGCLAVARDYLLNEARLHLHCRRQLPNVALVHTLAAHAAFLTISQSWVSCTLFFTAKPTSLANLPYMRVSLPCAQAVMPAYACAHAAMWRTSAGGAPVLQRRTHFFRDGERVVRSLSCSRRLLWGSSQGLVCAPAHVEHLPTVHK